MTHERPIDEWESFIQQTIDACDGCVIDRVVVRQETTSTQDDAFNVFDGVHPIALIASRQTQGRGQRGNRWDDGDKDTLAISIAIAHHPHDPIRLSASAGLAAMIAVRRVCVDDVTILVKWPNDVVARTTHGDRKVAGVLIEIRDNAAVIGIGINTRSRAWSHLDAISIEELTGDPDRVALACVLIEELTRWISADDHAIRDAWMDHDAMIATRRAFIANNTRVEGDVISLDPLTTIRVRTDHGIEELDVHITRND